MTTARRFRFGHSFGPRPAGAPAPRPPDGGGGVGNLPRRAPHDLRRAPARRSLHDQEDPMAFGLPTLPDDFDATDQLDEVRVGTSNVATFLRTAVDAGEAGVNALLERAQPWAEWLDGVLGHETGPVQPAPADLPTDRLIDDAEAAQTLGV